MSYKDGAGKHFHSGSLGHGTRARPLAKALL